MEKLKRGLARSKRSLNTVVAVILVIPAPLPQPLMDEPGGSFPSAPRAGFLELASGQVAPSGYCRDLGVGGMVRGLPIPPLPNKTALLPSPGNELLRCAVKTSRETHV